MMMMSKQMGWAMVRPPPPRVGKGYLEKDIVDSDHQVVNKELSL